MRWLRGDGARSGFSPMRSPAKARAWWEACLSGRERVGLAWLAILGYLRIVTNRRASSGVQLSPLRLAPASDATVGSPAEDVPDVVVRVADLRAEVPLVLNRHLCQVVSCERIGRGIGVDVGGHQQEADGDL